MSFVSLYVSIITLNINGLSYSIKGIEWLNRLRNRTKLLAAYKRLTLTLRTHIGSREEMGKNFHAFFFFKEIHVLLFIYL